MLIDQITVLLDFVFEWSLCCTILGEQNSVLTPSRNANAKIRGSKLTYVR